MKPRAVALLSGGLDSMLAIRIMQDQGIEVEALNFRTIFTCCKDESAQAARDLGVRLTVVGQEDDYLDLIKTPRYGYGRGANPCVDCRIYMFERAAQFMNQVDASFLVSGEVVGQRPMSQKMSDLRLIGRDTRLEDLLLRPLSAKLLPPTLPERNGLVDRERLYDFQGRSRKGLIALARQYGFPAIPTPSTGCILTERHFGGKVHDLIEFDPQARRWSFELLKVGRHFRYDAATKVVLGKDEAQNEMLRQMGASAEASANVVLEPANFTGPTALVEGAYRESAARYACGLILRYTKHTVPDDAALECRSRGERWQVPVARDQEAELAETL